MNNININGYRRVSKTTAKKLFLDGHIITVAGCKINPANIYGVCVGNISRERCAGMVCGSDNVGLINYFNAWVNSFIYYNCNYECGYYPAFYINE